ncbi:hypothetical protein SAMN04883147_102762 [Streptomyces sp. DpondAA-F4]|nr:hypothetical protein SAMN04883147_102762 [Streptomyces sp. DpondAA-F4]
MAEGVLGLLGAPVAVDRFEGVVPSRIGDLDEALAAGVVRAQRPVEHGGVACSGGVVHHAVQGGDLGAVPGEPGLPPLRGRHLGQAVGGVVVEGGALAVGVGERFDQVTGVGVADRAAGVVGDLGDVLAVVGEHQGASGRRSDLRCEVPRVADRGGVAVLVLHLGDPRGPGGARAGEGGLLPGTAAGEGEGFLVRGFAQVLLVALGRGEARAVAGEDRGGARGALDRDAVGSRFRDAVVRSGGGVPADAVEAVEGVAVGQTGACVGDVETLDGQEQVAVTVVDLGADTVGELGGEELRPGDLADTESVKTWVGRSGLRQRLPGGLRRLQRGAGRCLRHPQRGGFRLRRGGRRRSRTRSRKGLGAGGEGGGHGGRRGGHGQDGQRKPVSVAPHCGHARIHEGLSDA